MRKIDPTSSQERVDRRYAARNRAKMVHPQTAAADAFKRAQKSEAKRDAAKARAAQKRGEDEPAAPDLGQVSATGQVTEGHDSRSSPNSPAPTGLRVPAHGRGMLRAPFQPGEVMQTHRYQPLREVRALARVKSAAVARRLIDIALEDPDTRVAVVACQQVLTWAYGRPENLKDDSAAAPLRLDVTKLSARELQALLKAVETRDVAAPPEPEPTEQDPRGTVIEGTAEPPE